MGDGPWMCAECGVVNCRYHENCCWCGKHRDAPDSAASEEP